MSTVALDRPVLSPLRRTLASLAVLVTAAALPVFATVGAFTDAEDPFPRSVEAPAAR